VEVQCCRRPQVEHDLVVAVVGQVIEAALELAGAVLMELTVDSDPLPAVALGGGEGDHLTLRPPLRGRPWRGWDRGARRAGAPSAAGGPASAGRPPGRVRGWWCGVCGSWLLFQHQVTTQLCPFASSSKRM